MAVGVRVVVTLTPLGSVPGGPHPPGARRCARGRRCVSNPGAPPPLESRHRIQPTLDGWGSARRAPPISSSLEAAEGRRDGLGAFGGAAEGGLGCGEQL